MQIKKTVIMSGLVVAVAFGGITGCKHWGQGASDGRTEGRMVDDKNINSQVQQRLKQSPVYKFPSVDVTTYRGVVQLSGFVDTDTQKQQAERIAQQVPGISRVVNNIIIKPEPAAPQGSSGNANPSNTSPQNNRNQTQPSTSGATGGSQDTLEDAGDEIEDAAKDAGNAAERATDPDNK